MKENRRDYKVRNCKIAMEKTNLLDNGGERRGRRWIKSSKRGS